MVNIHSLKEKKKNINFQLGKLYTTKKNLVSKIQELEKAKLDVKTLIHQNKKKKVIKK